jgi:hypothetical protein
MRCNLKKKRRDEERRDNCYEQEKRVKEMLWEKEESEGKGGRGEKEKEKKEVKRLKEKSIHILVFHQNLNLMMMYNVILEKTKVRNYQLSARFFLLNL